MNSRNENVVWQPGHVSRQMFENRNGHRAALLWFTGLSGAGKSTLASAVQERLHAADCKSFVLDGDNLRHGLCSDLSFSSEDRSENIRRTAEVAKLFVDSGCIVLAAFISPLTAQRQLVRSVVGDEDMMEVYCRCSLDVCAERDPKGLYRRALAGEIKDFTGISSPYEPPAMPALTLDTARLNLENCIDRVIGLLVRRGVVTDRISPRLAHMLPDQRVQLAEMAGTAPDE
jgi:adenylylsulfate kinase